MKANKLYVLLISLFLSYHSFAQQKVGLVLSGGGATGIAHIGVLKALEEHEIPIDFITGTSAGALIGSLYASGYSPEEIEEIVTSPDFVTMATGGKLPEQHFLLREENNDASMVGLSVSLDSILTKSLPTNFTSSAFLDFEMMRLLGTVSASRGQDFDSLFVPFRCVASDVVEKKSVVFNHGNLNEAVRASMTYPFYYTPIRVDGVLLFDGGLYNNFPADVMYMDFGPDYIVGSNVSYNAAPPGEDDLIGQVTNMLVRYSDFSLPCTDGFIIEPHSEVSSFDFSNAAEAIEDGYNATIAQIDSIKSYVERRIPKEELTKKRSAFRATIPELVVTDVSTEADDFRPLFARRSLIRRRKNERLSADDLEKRYFRLYSASQVQMLYPTLTKLNDSSYHMNVQVRKERDFKVEAGGHLSSRPVNTGYFGLTYQTLGRVMTKSKLESYFGKFYGSAKARFTLDLPAVYPLSTSTYFVLNRWDYFRSFATFFEDVTPSFLVQNEIYAGIDLAQPIGNTIKSTFDGRMFRLEDNYYQSQQFSNEDTTDITNFNGFSVSWELKQNTLNRKQFASSGHFFKLKARYVMGREHSTSGSTAPVDYDIIQNHSWFNFSVDYQSFIIDKPHFHLGIQGKMVYNSQTLFANYTASLLAMTEFSPIPDVHTYFLPEYRSPQFISGGLNTIFSINKKIDLRVDGFIYQPFIQLVENSDGTASMSPPFKGETFIASASAIYHSFIGPIRFTFNYFPRQENPYEIQFSLGYALFNERAIR